MNDKNNPNSYAGIYPVDNRILVEAGKAETKTKAGIIIPDASQQKPMIGLVRAVGVQIDQNQIKPGMKVLHGRHAGIEYKKDGVDYFIMRQQDIFAVLI